MKSIGFIGQMDNNGLVLCFARIIAAFGKKVIIIDATSTQKTRYTVPRPAGVSRQEQFVTQYDSVEVAIGFNNILELKKYMLGNGEDFNDYEYVIINTDREEMLEEFDFKNANYLFFTSTYDLYDLHRGIELLRFLCAMKRREDGNARLSIDKILYYTDIKTQSDDYVDNLLAMDLPIDWNPVSITLSYDDGDLSAYIQNQYSNKIEFKSLNKRTKEGLIEAVIRVLGEPKDRVIRAVKNIEKNSSFSRR